MFFSGYAKWECMDNYMFVINGPIGRNVTNGSMSSIPYKVCFMLQK